MLNQEDVYYIIMNNDENKFYKRCEFYVDTLLQAQKFLVKDYAQYEIDRVLNSLQKDLFTKIKKIKFTTTPLGE